MCGLCHNCTGVNVARANFRLFCNGSKGSEVLRWWKGFFQVNTMQVPAHHSMTPPLDMMQGSDTPPSEFHRRLWRLDNYSLLTQDETLTTRMIFVVFSESIPSMLLDNGHHQTKESIFENGALHNEDADPPTFTAWVSPPFWDCSSALLPLPQHHLVTFVSFQFIDCFVGSLSESLREWGSSLACTEWLRMILASRFIPIIEVPSVQ